MSGCASRPPTMVVFNRRFPNRKILVSPIRQILTTPPKPIAELSTKPINSPSEGGVEGIKLSREVPYAPVPFTNPVPMDGEDGETYYYIKERVNYEGVSFYLPTYISHNLGQGAGGLTNLTKVTIVYVDEDSDPEEILTKDSRFSSHCNITRNPHLDLAQDSWCVQSVGGALVFHARAMNDFNFLVYNYLGLASARYWDYAYVKLQFKVQGRDQFIYSDSLATNISLSGMKPGNDLYYLTKLGRLELLGIPQIFYEPIYCNSNRFQLVPGIFDFPEDTRYYFDHNSFVSDNQTVNGRALENIYDAGNSTNDPANPNHRVVLQDKMLPEPVFSSSQFTLLCQGQWGGQGGLPVL